ncbi:DUF748 domain-containing protein [Halothiobacillus sp. DCM-1]|uniref:DUF748 domain-containing protein n=1 Tax=Halothiobacillus sp. DCM-1 TaxID=3112558 RepID=UPI00324909D4
MRLTLPAFSHHLTRPLPLSRRWQRGLLGLLLLLLFWTSLGWWLPALLTPRLSALASAQLGTPVHIGRITLLPWMLRVEIDQLQIGETAAPVLSLNRAVLDLSARSLWDRAPVLDAVQLVDPVLHLAQSADGQWNITPLLARFSHPTTPPPSSSTPPLFSVNNAALINGQILLEDAKAGVVHHIDDLNLVLPRLSSLPGEEYLPALPRLSARVDGSALALQARSAVFVPGSPTHVALAWQGIDLAKLLTGLAPYLPPNLPVTLQQGQLGATLQINSQQANPANPAGMLAIDGSIQLDQLALTAPADGVTQQLARVQMNGLSVDVPARRMHLVALTLDTPQTTIDLSTLLKQRTGAAPSPSPGAAAPTNAPGQSPATATNDAPPTSAPSTSAPANPTPPPWQWAIDQIQLSQGQLILQHPGWSQPHGWQQLNATLVQVHDPASSTLPTALTLTGQTTDATPATLALNGAFTWGTAPRIELTRTQLTRFNLADWLRPWASALPVDLTSATLTTEASARWQPAAWRVMNGRIVLNDLHLRPRQGPASSGSSPAGMACQTLTIAGIQAEAAAAAPAVQVGEITADQLALHLTRNRRGEWTPFSPPTPASTARAAPVSKTKRKRNSAAVESTAAAPAPQRPQIELAKVVCRDCAVTLTDESVQPPTRLGLKTVNLTADQIDPARLNRPIPFTLQAQSLTQGKLSLAGNLQPKPLSLKAKVAVDHLQLAPIQPYLNPYVNIRLQSAALSTDGTLELSGTDKTPATQARFTGNSSLQKVFLRDRLTNSPFLRWESLSLQRMGLRWTPAEWSADLGSVQLNQFYGRIIVNTDGHLNLSDIVKSEKNEATRSVTQAAPAPQTLPSGEAKATLPPNPNPPPKIRWQRIALQGGQVDFTDHFIKPNYSAKVTDLTGSVSALAWDQPHEASIALNGRVDGSAPVEIKGQANPLARPLALDITADTQGIELTRLSTYAARYAGYGIEKGSLSATLHYQVKDNELTASNHIVLDQLTFGTPVESPEATKLPVLLAVSLLQDRNGVIDIDLPISGTLTDPEFSMGGIIVKVIVNLLTKAITAPFSLLGAAFGGGSEDPAVLPFEPGSDTLGSAQTEQLDSLIKALNDRPQLKLDITGFADPAVDTDGLKQRALLHRLKEAKAKATDQPIDSVEISPEDMPHWLAVVYKNTKLKDKPKNLVGMSKTLPAEEMRQRLLAAIDITPQALQQLADHRADTVREYLTAPGRIAANRVGLTASHLGTQDQKGKGSTARVQFSLH